MMKDLYNDVKRTFESGTTLTRIIIVNIAVFVFVSILFVFTNFGVDAQTQGFYQQILHFISINSDPSGLILRFWANITYMFTHTGFWHLLWNMLFLYWFGRIVGELIGDRHILPLYILGGLAGAVMFVLGNQLVDYPGDLQYCIGASASVMALIVASGIIAPNYGMNLLLIGRVSLKYVVIVLVFLDIVGASGRSNTGGHFAHIGGVLLGILYIRQLRSGRDFSRWFDPIYALFQKQYLRKTSTHKNMSLRYVNKRSSKKVSSEPKSGIHQAKVDAILDKIKKVGYDKLTQDEKDYLFLAAKEDRSNPD